MLGGVRWEEPPLAVPVLCDFLLLPKEGRRFRTLDGRNLDKRGDPDLGDPDFLGLGIAICIGVVLVVR